MERIGLIAGSGNFPAVFAGEAKKKGTRVIAFCIKDITDPDFSKYVYRTHWVDAARFQIQKFLFLLMAERIKKIVMVGKVDKTLVFNRFRSNKGVDAVIKSSKDGRDYSLLEDITKRFEKIGIKVVDGMEYLKDLLPDRGVLTKRHPSDAEERDVEFGMRIAKEIARLDIGQTVTVKDKAIVTVEAMEGTDKAIARAFDLVGEDYSVVKVARPRQDMRWDVPLVGPETIEAMIEHKARVLAIEAKKMFLVEKDKAIARADLHNITVVVL